MGLAWLDLWWFLPTMGLSPTRPGRLAVIPPVEVAAAVEPLLSSATAPTVSWPSVSHTADVDGVASLQSEKKKLKQEALGQYSLPEQNVIWLYFIAY